MKRVSLFLFALPLLSACAVGPDYQRPPLNVPSGYKEQGDWKVSQPAEAGSDAAWWSTFADPALDQLERQVVISNQTVLASEAAFRQASAAAEAANAQLFPTLSLDGGMTRSKTRSVVASRTTGAVTSGSNVGNAFSLSGSASWVLDIWGKLRRASEAAQATAQASAADLAAARLTAQATLASDYFTLRSTDQLIRLLDATVEAYAQSLRITRNQYAQGTAALSDVRQAEDQLEATRAAFINAGITRAQLEHAIAVLVGKAPAEFSIAPVAGVAEPPAVPLVLPSALLERRPDIAAAEQAVAAANANVGVAIAGFFPTISLTGSSGFQNSSMSNLLQASNNVWSFGPNLAQTVFDAGLLSDQLAEARATYDQQVATYRQTVLVAFQGIEDQLASLHILARQQEVEDRAVAAATDAERLILNQYKAGTVAYTSVVTAQAAALTARQQALTIRQNRLTATVALIQDLGGGWQAEQRTAEAATTATMTDPAR
jgi:NodT family efflux transporter outer membrane factor (OMF) lipoprotein